MKTSSIGKLALKAALGMALAAMGGSVSASAAAPAPAPAKVQPWWTHAVIYEIYPRSFQDSNGDGIGDLNGVTQRLDYLKALGIDAIWLTPFYPSPNADFGYDVADYTAVAREYGTMADWDRLTSEARKRGIRVMVDLVLNHSSDQHPWFKESRSSRNNPKRDWYVWHDPAPNGGPPTNWESIFGGSTWEYDKPTGQYYYHVFLKEQPDLNWANPGLQKAMHDVARFWLSHGAAGFRLDATPYLFEDTNWPNDPDVKSGPSVGLKPYNSNLPATREALRGLRKVVDSFPGDRVLLGENAISSIDDLRRVYGAKGDEINLPMDFLYKDVTSLDAATFKARIDEAELKLDGFPPVFHFSNHDTPRQWSRFGDGLHNDQIARITAAMTLTLRGTALMYYGEEIGMPDLSPDELRDIPLGPKRKVADNRDPERSPMQWSAGKGAGFTSGEPWLPVGRSAAKVNAAAQRADAGSLFHWYARLLELRKTNAAMRDGAYVPLESGNAKVLAYARRDAGGHGVLVLLNMSDQPQTPAISGWAGKAPDMGATLMTSHSGGAAGGLDPTLEPFGVRLVAFKGG
ncbi:glycoside hydrolase family 13 protein [Novosphingobium sp. KACC 22771]|uniref:glycoside hydrolase family 13 protein n=1 Tax=Novosphingobium sp. KACC 22771 TaxID=3025670 RepID=UPI002365FCE8|nr:alpha-glucosidase [Novosphingobium sp. KACC 22771]WDF74494.1 alpha-glucosidase [Novosphingobium sp. KACC 22771]